MQEMKRLFLLSIALLLSACAPQNIEEVAPREQPSSSSSSSLSASSYAPRPTPHAPPPTPLPPTVSLPIPFSPQAPSANWDQLHEESCEEMSLIMVHHFLAGTPLAREQAEREIQEMVQWETKHGFPQDVTVGELGKIAEQYYGYRSRITIEPTVNDLKRELTDGHPVIVPAAGRDLGNPYFSGEGPWYHMLVLRGYGFWGFVTNDPGTKRGEGYVYRFSTLMDAIHDWTGVKEEIRKGRRAVLIIEK